MFATEKKLLSTMFVKLIPILCCSCAQGMSKIMLPLLPQVQKNEILSDIFNDEGIIGSMTFEDLEKLKQAAYEKWKKKLRA